MIKQNQRFLNFVNVLSDALIVLLAYLLASWARFDFLGGAPDNIAAVGSSQRSILLAACIYAGSLVFVLALLRYYNSARNRRIREDAVTLVEANLLCTLGVGTLLYVYRLQDFSRGVLISFFVFSTLLLLAKRILQRAVLMDMRKHGYNQKHVVVVGTGALARQYALDIAAEKRLGFFLDGFIGKQPEGEPLPLLGGIDGLEAYLVAHNIDEVIVALDPDEGSWVDTVIRVCEKSGTKVGIVPFFNNLIPSYPSIEIIGRTKVINLRSNPLDNLGFAAAKRFIDLLVSLVCLIVLSPLFAFIALGIRRSSPGPVFFKQTRVGRNKKLFSMYKFRSMRVNSAQDTAWSTNDDQRKTAFGSFLRKFSLDELPQLINVLRGEMSLVGPRPEIPFYVEQFRESIPLYMVKHQVRPGMTGWAQVNGYRGDTSIEKRIEYDVWYIEHWSLGLDIRILALTLVRGWVNHEKLTRGKADKS